MQFLLETPVDFLSESHLEAVFSQNCWPCISHTGTLRSLVTVQKHESQLETGNPLNSAFNWICLLNCLWTLTERQKLWCTSSWTKRQEAEPVLKEDIREVLIKDNGKGDPHYQQVANFHH